MPTNKKRINITVDDEAYEALKRLAARQKRPVASVGLSLIEHALELEEDRYFSSVADRRLAKREKRISHAKAWA
jgi:predicted DNA-binding protein